MKPIEYKKLLNSDKWKQTKNQFKKNKDAYKCWICGTDKNLSIHHMSYKKKLFFDFTNLVVLCNKHHYLLHFENGKKDIHKNFNRVKEFKKSNEMSHM